MKKCIVITTINKPTKGIAEFARTGFDLIVVGDKKTPPDYRRLDCIFLDLQAQQRMFPAFSENLPLNNYARKNAGYAYALAHGYDLIAESDDDNVPLPGWGEEPTGFSRTVVSPEHPNIYKLYTKEHIWPRGFPLDEIRAKKEIRTENRESNKIHIVQGLVNGNPDVDAIFRLVSEKPVDDLQFENNGNYALDKGVWSPFNSQNTFWTDKSAFPWLYLPITVPFRCTDIYRSYIAQYAVWEYGGRLGFTEASVFQDRNAHDLMEDFRDEVQMHQNFYRIKSVLQDVGFRKDGEDLIRIYTALHKKDVVSSPELKAAAEWTNIVTAHL